MDILMDIIHFIIGDPHRTMGIVGLLVLFNEIASWFQVKRKQKTRKFMDFIEKVFCYGVFISLGNILDVLMVNNIIDNIVDYKGPVQMLVCLELLRREGLSILSYLEKREGFSIPVLNDGFESIKTVKKSGPKDTNEEILKQLESLSNEIKALNQSDTKETDS